MILPGGCRTFTSRPQGKTVEAMVQGCLPRCTSWQRFYLCVHVRASARVRALVCMHTYYLGEREGGAFVEVAVLVAI